jgi:DNA-binding transcriptional LysR family regulator
MREPNWDLYRTLQAVLREGSLSGAARVLALAQPTVGRHIEALEQAMGLALFTRSQLGLTPTEAALELRPSVEALASAAAALLRVASGQGAGARGTVRITASEVIGAEALPQILCPLREAYPDLVIELALSNRVENLLNREADIAVRMVRPEQASLIARRIGEVTLGVHAHRAYLERRGSPETLPDLAGHTLIGFDQATEFTRSLQPQFGGFDPAKFALRSDNDLAQLAAIRAGYGIGVCQVGLAKRDPNLIRLMASLFAVKLGMWIVMHEDLKTTTRCRVVFDALVEGLARYVANDKAAAEASCKA